MTNPMDDLDHKFKSSAENFSLSPSNDSWTKVESALNEKKRKRKFIIFFLLGFTVVSGFLLFNRTNKPVTNETKHLKAVENTIVASTPAKQNKITATEIKLAKPIEEKVKPIQQRDKSTLESSLSSKVRLQNSLNHEKQSLFATKESKPSNVPSSAIKEDAPSKIITAHDKKEQVQIDVNETSSVNSQIDSSGVSNVIAETVYPMENTTSITLIDSLRKDSTANKTDSLPANVDGFRWSISIGAAPTMSATNYKEVGDYQILANYRDSSDKNLLTMNYKLLIHYKLSKKVELFTGIAIRNFKQELLSHQAVYKYDTNTIVTLPFPVITVSRAYANLSNDSLGVVKSNFSYLEIPFGISYNLFSRGKFNLSVDGQIGMNKLISSESYKYEASSFNYKKSASTDLKPWIFSYGVGLSAKQFIAKRISLEFSPAYYRFPNSIFKSNQPLEQFFDQAELNFSIRYFLK